MSHPTRVGDRYPPKTTVSGVAWDDNGSVACVQRSRDKVACMQPLSGILAIPEGLSPTQVARRAGINRSTLYRVIAGDVEPSLRTLEELAIVHGYQLKLELEPLSDPHASAAARVLLDARYVDTSADASTREWVERLQRAGDDPITTVMTAGHAASLWHRADATFLRGDSTALRLASAGDAAGGSWAISGAPAMSLLTERQMTGLSVLWTTNADAAVATLSGTHKTVGSPLNADCVIAPAPTDLFADAFTVDMVRYVAPIQALLDCIGLGGELQDAAIEVAQEWSR